MLARYVPGAVRDQLSRGISPECGEREVTVMFLDLRDFTAFVDDRSPEEAFRFINCYTETMSRIVEGHGGSVVEFNGDGMMAIFGAVTLTRGKERSAIRAALEMQSVIGELGIETPGFEPCIGIGIATGRAFVGNIRAADRWIWSAIGRTTNLASRLQGKSRELGATIVVDATTRERTASLTRHFDDLGSVAIRGCRRLVEIFALRSNHPGPAAMPTLRASQPTRC